jgi:hypothetical protein
MLAENSSIWDIIFIIDTNRMLLNRIIPVVNDMMVKRSIEGPILGWGGDNCFIVLLNIISGTIPMYVTVDVMQTFLNLDYFSKFS